MLIFLFSLVAALALFMKPKDKTKLKILPFPLYDLVLKASSARGSIILNGISIGNHQTGDSEREATIALTPWLKNGNNELYITTSAPLPGKAPDLTATLVTTYIIDEPKSRQLFHVRKPAANKIVIEAKGLPSWTWQKGEATFHDAEEIKTAVRKLHQAFRNKDIKTIRAMEKPLFTDMVLLTGRDGLERRQYRGEIIMKGGVEPLRPMIIVPFDNGRIMRVSNADGEAPIRVYFNYGGGGKVILTGHFWSKIDGTWQVVR